MQYLLSFLEGIITFVSPCLLPMLPVYLSYFAGQDADTGESRPGRTLLNVAGFVLGFTLVFVALGAFAGSFGALVHQHQRIVNLIAGAVIFLFGLNFLEIIRIPFLNGLSGGQSVKLKYGFFSAVLFGIVFSISWTPCVGTFLGSALLLAASTGKTLQGILMLLCFSLGLGVPFLLSALLLDRLKGAFDFIKKHYRTINRICGILLVVLGLLVATGLINYIYALL